MSKKRNVIIAFALLFAVCLTGSIVAGTFAKYTSQVDGGNAEAQVAKWAFDTDNANSAISFELGKTYDADTLVDGKIAPGTEGNFKISLSNANSEVGVNYTINLSKENVPTNLKFYSDNTYAAEKEITGEDPFAGTLAPNATAEDVTIYWKWAYETTDGDVNDTTDGTNASAMSVTATIVGTQVQPTE